MIELERANSGGRRPIGCELLNAAAIVLSQTAIGAKPHRAVRVLSNRAHVIRRQPVKESDRAPLMKI